MSGWQRHAHPIEPALTIRGSASYRASPSYTCVPPLTATLRPHASCAWASAHCRCRGAGSRSRAAGHTTSGEQGPIPDLPSNARSCRPACALPPPRRACSVCPLDTQNSVRAPTPPACTCTLFANYAPCPQHPPTPGDTAVTGSAWRTARRRRWCCAAPRIDSASSTAASTCWRPSPAGSAAALPA